MRIDPRLALSAGLLLACFGCRTAASGPYSQPPHEERNTSKAERLTKRAAELMGEDDENAERLLREALAADLFFGPAHNNLGVIYLGQEKLYEAAGEFEWARKLMPGHPDPRLNLGLTLERAGQVEESIQSYTAALEVYPNYLPAIQGLTSLTLRSGREEERLEGWLKEISLRSSDEDWKQWALQRLLFR